MRRPLPLSCRCPQSAIAVTGGQNFFSLTGIAMADHSEVAYTTADGNDYKEHERTYLAFLTMTKWGIGIVVAILILMAYFLVH